VQAWQRLLPNYDAPASADRAAREPRHGDLVLDRERTGPGPRPPVALTAVEFRLLATLLEADGRVLTRDQLLDASTAGRVRDPRSDRRRPHRPAPRRLGDDADASRYVATVRGVGYRAAPVTAEGGIQR
jgi:two-component system alkaline phosphatase synthesis response regulator PhoP